MRSERDISRSMHGAKTNNVYDKIYEFRAAVTTHPTQISNNRTTTDRLPVLPYITNSHVKTKPELPTTTTTTMIPHNILNQRLQEDLNSRVRTGTHRSLTYSNNTRSMPKASEKDRSRNPSDVGDASLQHDFKISAMVDFSSNDYLGLSRSKAQIRGVMLAYEKYVSTAFQSSYNNKGSNKNRNDEEYTRIPVLGATGSRLLSGDSALSTRIEKKLALIHNRPEALLFNSGYDANVSILSCLPRFDRGDVLIMDELCHNSLQMGWRMARGAMSIIRDDESVRTFQHNCVNDLKRVLKSVVSKSNSLSIPSLHANDKTIFIVVESVYSMEGDIAPLKEILALAKAFNAHVIVDEAHGLGVYGATNVNDLTLNLSHSYDVGENISLDENCGRGGSGVLAAMHVELHPSLLCSIHTFGKAAGCHGAVVACNNSILKEYLINYARPFIYSTSMSPHSLISIEHAYDYFTSMKANLDRAKLFNLVRSFRSKYVERIQHLLCDSSHTHLGSSKCKNDLSKHKTDLSLLSSPSPIQSIVICGNTRCQVISKQMQMKGFDVYPIRAPTVPIGQERIRVVLHVYNTPREIIKFIDELVQCLHLEQKKTFSNINSTNLLHSRL